MNYNPGDIVQVFFPFSEGEDRDKKIIGKERPVLIVTTPDAYGDFVAIALSSKGGHRNTVALQATDFASGGSRRDSFARADKVFTFNGQAVIQRFGVVKPAFLSKVRGALCPALGCR